MRPKRSFQLRACVLPLRKPARLVAALLLAFSSCAESRAENSQPGDWLRAMPGWTYQFPADHAVHPDFKTEWWYFTGNLTGENGKEYGYELTFFRQGVLPPGQRDAQTGAGREHSRFVQNDFKFAHFAITDLASGQFHYTQKLSRGAYGEAGFATAEPGTGTPFVWLEDWTLTAEKDGAWRIKAKTKEPTAMEIDLRLTSQKPPIIEGTDGISQKSAGLGNASQYYSLTRLTTEGGLRLGSAARMLTMRGNSWFDHEWASNQLGADQIGWNWFCLQFDDHTELMLYAMRRADGSTDPVSSGTYVDANGNTEHLKREDFQLQPLKTWHSDKTGATYPLSWQVNIPSHGIAVTVHARLDDQELALPQITYWEGAMSAEGTRSGHHLTGQGYMELTGYAGQLVGLSQPGREGQSRLRTSPR